MTVADTLNILAKHAARAATLPELIERCDDAARQGAEIREALNMEERVAFDAFATLANAARHVLTLQHA